MGLCLPFIFIDRVTPYFSYLFKSISLNFSILLFICKKNQIIHALLSYPADQLFDLRLFFSLSDGGFSALVSLIGTPSVKQPDRCIILPHITDQIFWHHCKSRSHLLLLCRLSGY